MKYSTENITRNIVGRYEGRRIAGTSGDLWDAILTTRYNFGTFTITVTKVPALWDREQDRILLSGRVGTILNRGVEAMAETIAREEQASREPEVREILRSVAINYAVDGHDFLSEAA